MTELQGFTADDLAQGEEYSSLGPDCARGHKIDGNNVIQSGCARRCRTCREQYLIKWRASHEVA